MTWLSPREAISEPSRLARATDGMLAQNRFYCQHPGVQKATLLGSFTKNPAALAILPGLPSGRHTYGTPMPPGVKAAGVTKIRVVGAGTASARAVKSGLAPTSLEVYRGRDGMATGFPSTFGGDGTPTGMAWRPLPVKHRCTCTKCGQDAPTLPQAFAYSPAGRCPWTPPTPRQLTPGRSSPPAASTWMCTPRTV